MPHAIAAKCFGQLTHYVQVSSGNALDVDCCSRACNSAGDHRVFDLLGDVLQMNVCCVSMCMRVYTYVCNVCMYVCKNKLLYIYKQTYCQQDRVCDLLMLGKNQGSHLGQSISMKWHC